jgi:hypothetical protein
MHFGTSFTSCHTQISLQHFGANLPIFGQLNIAVHNTLIRNNGILTTQVRARTHTHTHTHIQKKIFNI